MKNSSSQSRGWILLVLVPIGLATAWDWYRHGPDWVMPVLLLAAGCAAFVLARRPVRPDERMQVLEGLVREIAAGKVTGRITNIGPKDAIGQLCWHVNNMLDQLEACFREQAAVWRIASTGSFFRRAQPVGLHGVFRQALADTNSSLEVLEREAKLTAEHRSATERAQEEMGRLIAAASRGDFRMRIDEAGKEGFFLKLARDINALSTTTEQGLEEVARVLRAVAQGDLTQRVQAQYEGIFGELKDDTNATLDCLRQIVGRIQSGTGAISAASKSIATWNQDLSSRTEEQASQLVQTASSMEQLNATVKQNADSARQANELAQASNAIASRGGETVRSVASTMGEIQDSSRKIANIIGVIDRIAFQTNILALNAAVEAARAGEQGRGFAVVAGEVRKLAQSSAAAAKEIKSLIDASVAKVNNGVKLVQEAGSTMDDVVTSFRKVAELVTGISAASREQSTGIDQVAQAVGKMDAVTQQNAALVEQAAAAAESLEEQAANLVNTAGNFRLEAIEVL